MENTKTLHALDEFAKTKPKDIPKELDDYLRHVAASGDPVYQWSLVKFLFRQKLLNVVMEFYESCPMMDVPISPNLDPFNFETIKKRLLDRYDLFAGVPFTIQRIAELLTAPRKQYNRLDKFMRALEKNVWVVSTRDPATRETSDQLNLVNGALSSDSHTEENETEPAAAAQGETEDEPLSAGENCLKPEEISENGKKQTESQVTDESEPVADLKPEESSSENSSSLDATENVTIELPSSDTATEEEEDEEEKLDEDPTPEPDSTVDSEPTTEEDKTEEIVVTELDEKESIPETVEPVLLAVEPPATEEPETTAEQAENDPEPLRVGIKRKCEDEDEEDLSPSKKLDTESSAVAEPSIEKVDEEAAVAEPPVQIIINKEPEVSMDSVVESEEKLAMVIEEPELAMEVDETSIQSPMAQEDTVEAMEESELALS